MWFKRAWWVSGLVRFQEALGTSSPGLGVQPRLEGVGALGSGCLQVFGLVGAGGWRSQEIL